MKMLDAVNYMLPKLGEHEVTSIEVKHPTVALILPAIEDQLMIVLNKGWWFNEFDMTIYPTVGGELILGTEIISVVPYGDNLAVQRGNRMYNPKTLSYVFDQPLEAKVRVYVPFEELPENAAVWVRNTALCNTYVADIGATSDVEVWNNVAVQAQSDLLAEHLRNKKYNTRRSRKWRKFKGALKG